MSDLTLARKHTRELAEMGETAKGETAAAVEDTNVQVERIKTLPELFDDFARSVGTMAATHEIIVERLQSTAAGLETDVNPKNVKLGEEQEAAATLLRQIVGHETEHPIVTDEIRPALRVWEAAGTLTTVSLGVAAARNTLMLEQATQRGIKIGELETAVRNYVENMVGPFTTELEAAGTAFEAQGAGAQGVHDGAELYLTTALR